MVQHPMPLICYSYCFEEFNVNSSVRYPISYCIKKPSSQTGKLPVNQGCLSSPQGARNQVQIRCKAMNIINLRQVIIIFFGACN